LKRVLIVMATLYNGGAEKSLVNMLNEFSSDRYEIDLLLFKKRGMFLKQVPSYVNVLETPQDLKRMFGTAKDSGLLLPWRLLGNLIARIFTRNVHTMRGMRWKYFYSPTIKNIEQSYDVAIAYLSDEILWYVDEKVKAKRKIGWIHNDYRSAGYSRKYDYPHLERMSGIVSISNHCVEIIKEEFPEFATKTYMVENITSAKVIRQKAAEFMPKEYTAEMRILSVGRLHEQKGFDLAIDAAAILKERNIDFCWYVIGAGDIENELKERIYARKVQDCFVLLGVRENPYPYIENCTIFVQTSRYEGKSVVLDEAKILAKPIIATNYPTVKDQLKNRKEGILVSMDAKGIADGIEELLNNKEKQQELSSYLSAHKYDNCEEIQKYCELIDG